MVELPNSFNSNAKLGKGDWAILEADRGLTEVFKDTYELFNSYQYRFQFILTIIKGIKI